MNSILRQCIFFLLLTSVSFVVSASNKINEKHINVAFNEYLKLKENTKYKFLLDKNNYEFIVSNSGKNVQVEILFKSKEFTKRTGKTIFGGGGNYLVSKENFKIIHHELYR